MEIKEKILHENKEVETILNGTMGFRYTDKPKGNYDNPKVDYMQKVALMNEDDLFAETKSKIWLSAYASNNPRSDYHWQCDFCYDLLSLRSKESVYKKAHKEVSDSI